MINQVSVSNAPLRLYIACRSKDLWLKKLDRFIGEKFCEETLSAWEDLNMCEVVISAIEMNIYRMIHERLRSYNDFRSVRHSVNYNLIITKRKYVNLRA